MARTFTKFTLDPGGNLAYKSTGRAAPSSYTYRGQNVYGKDGRKIGTVARKLTPTERAKVEKAYQSRRKRKAAQGRRMAKGQPQKPMRKQPSKAVTVVKKPEALPERSTDFPEPSALAKQALAIRVKAAAVSIAAKWMQNYINRMDPEILWQMYQAGEYVLEIYFEYYEGEPADSKKPDYARLFIKRYQGYAGVEHGL